MGRVSECVLLSIYRESRELLIFSIEICFPRFGGCSRRRKNKSDTNWASAHESRSPDSYRIQCAVDSDFFLFLLIRSRINFIAATRASPLPPLACSAADKKRTVSLRTQFCFVFIFICGFFYHLIFQSHIDFCRRGGRTIYYYYWALFIQDTKYVPCRIAAQHHSFQSGRLVYAVLEHARSRLAARLQTIYESTKFRSSPPPPPPGRARAKQIV